MEKGGNNPEGRVEKIKKIFNKESESPQQSGKPS